MVNSNTQTEQQPEIPRTLWNEFSDILATHLVRELTAADTLTTTTITPDDHSATSQSSSENDNQRSPMRPFEGIGRIREQMAHIHRLSATNHYQADHTLPLHQPASSNRPRTASSNRHHQHPPSNETEADQERTDEFREHSIRRRSNHRPLLRLSDVDNHSLFEAFKRWGENRKRKHQDPLGQPHSHRTSLRDTQTSDNSNSQPTTAELAEAAARDSNPRRSLPAFYTPDDEQLKVRTVVIPIDTNPMERRKIIVAFSKDGSIRWKDSEQKTIYERSKDGLVGEEIGEIEFDYLCLPKKPLRKSCSGPHYHRPNTNNSNSNNNARESSTMTSYYLGPSSPLESETSRMIRMFPESETGRAIREALESINEARNQEPRTMRSHYDLHRWHLERPGHRYVAPGLEALVARHPRNSGSESATQTGPPLDRPSHVRPARLSRSTSSSVGRLTRRPIRWFERPTARGLLSAASRASNPDPNLLPPISSYSSSVRPFSSSSSPNDHPAALHEAPTDNTDSLYQQLYNPSHPLDQFLFSSAIHRSRP